eukprot:5589_1
MLDVLKEKQMLDVLNVMQQKQMRVVVYGQQKLLMKVNSNHQMNGIWTAKIANKVEFESPDEDYTAKIDAGCVEGDAAKTDESGGIWTAKIANEGEFESPDEGYAGKTEGDAAKTDKTWMC